MFKLSRYVVVENCEDYIFISDGKRRHNEQYTICLHMAYSLYTKNNNI